MRRTALPALAAATLALSLAACGTATSGEAAGSTTAASSPATATPSSPSAEADADSDADAGGDGDAAAPATAPGAYVTFAEYEKDPAAHADSKVVYFFHASWCPSCRATESAIDESGVPDGLTVVKVDYDTATDLRQRYGVTQQHTFVQVDGGGTELAKWTGSSDGAAILAATV